ncbi:MAG: hypothetical protein ACREK8_06190 [Gemmatimonadales bacterium]
MLKSIGTRFALLALFGAAPLVAQGAVMGSGKLPPGWMMRFDTRGNQPMPAPTSVSFVTMGEGLHVTSGPAAIYYNTKDVGHGIYQVSATFKQSKSMQHEAFGIFIGGSNLQDSTQNYLYFVIKPFDGSMLISHRNGRMNTAIVPETPATPEPAINRDSPTDGSATNTLLIHVAKDTVHFLINGKLVKALAKTQLAGASTDGQAGLRINHHIDMHIDGWALKK